MSAASIKFLNLLEEARYAYLAGDHDRLEVILMAIRDAAMVERFKVPEAAS